MVHCLVFRAGRLKRERAFLFVGSWMELVPSNITAVWYSVYWSLLRVSTYRTVSLTDSSITVCKFGFNMSQEMFREMDSPYHETLVQGREIAAWAILSRKFFDYNASQLCVGYTESKFFPRHAPSGPAIIHFLKAAGFSVSPTTPLQLFTTILFCSWAWSVGIAERWFVVLETIQWSWSWNSLTIDCERFSKSWMWTGSQWAQWVWSNARPCDYWL